jgi:hypothetical protein
MNKSWTQRDIDTMLLTAFFSGPAYAAKWIIQRALDHGCPLDAVLSGHKQQSLLLLLTMCNQVHFVQQLVAKGANTCIRSEFGHTPGHVVRSKAMCKALSQHNTKWMDATSDNGSTPLDLALKRRLVDVHCIAYLVKHSASTTVQAAWNTAEPSTLAVLQSAVELNQQRRRWKIRRVWIAAAVCSL